MGHTAPQTIRDLHVCGYEQNIVAENYTQPTSSLTLENVVSESAWSNDLFQGQGIYLQGIGGGVTINNSCLYRNGRPEWMPYYLPSIYRHNLYCNDDVGSLTIKNTIIWGAANAGVQHRSTHLVIDNCVIGDCGIGLLHVMGNATITNSVILGAHYVLAGDWTSNTAISSYQPFMAQNVVIAATPGQGNQPANDPLKHKLWPQGALCLGGTWSNSGHPPFVAPAPNWSPTLVNCHLVGPWPGVAVRSGPPASPSPVAGLTIHTGTLQYDPQPLIQKVLANTISATDAVNQIKASVLAAMPKA